MVWGMGLPEQFGDFFPPGDYVGWDEKLREYFKTKMPAEQKRIFGDPSSYIYYVYENLKSEPGVKPSPNYPPFGSIAAHEAPERFKIEKSYSSLGSLLKLSDRILAVDLDLKDMIEGCEPKKHLFFPIEIVMPKNVIYPKSYFVMVIGKYIESFLPEHSNPGSFKPDSGECFFFEPGKKAMSELTLSRQVFGNAHLWRERRMASPLICFSDQLITEISRSGLRLPKHFQLKEI